MNEPEPRVSDETYDDRQLAGIVSGLSKSMINALDGDPWPHWASIEALRSRGLMQEPGWLPTIQGSAVLDYIKRRGEAVVVESTTMSEGQSKGAVEVGAMPDTWWATVGRIHTALAGVFKHPWSLAVTGWVDGKPSMHVRVRAPNSDVFRYDRAFRAVVDEHVLPGYYNDGTDVDVEVAADGLRERGYYLYPETE